MQRQRFITTIKNVSEKKIKAQKLNWLSQCNKIDNYNTGGGNQKILKNMSKNKNNKCFFESLLSESFTSLGITVHLPLQDALQHCTDFWTCCGDSSDSNLVLLLCVLASNVHSYQNQCIFFCGSSQWPFIYSIDTESAQLIVWI